MSYTLNRAEQLEQAFCEMLDEAGPVVVAGIKMDPSRVLRIMDPIAYNTKLNSFFDAMGYDIDEE